MSCFISVVMCTHNPRADFITRALRALCEQTYQKDKWELIVIDNASEESVAPRFPIDWHPNARHVRENTLGLTHARLRGITESNGDIIIFVDDDNVLSTAFLSEVCRISREYKFLGVWGGAIRPEFECTPPNWTKEFWAALAVREFETIRWSNTLDDWRAQPCGAGLCIRRQVAEDYAARVHSDPRLQELGRRGKSLMSAEDIDLIYTARFAGLGWGTFPQLELTHLIPAMRTTKAYLLKLTEGIAASNVLLADRHGHPIEQTNWWTIALRFLMILACQGSRRAEFYLARKRGAARGKRLLALFASRGDDSLPMKLQALSVTAKER